MLLSVYTIVYTLEYTLKFNFKAANAVIAPVNPHVNTESYMRVKKRCMSVMFMPQYVH